jgi:hypothetical protein
MDKVADSGSADAGSIPARGTRKMTTYSWSFLYMYPMK